SSREMALGNSLPAPMVANILKALCNAGLVTSMRGAQGGYHLSRAAHRITLGEIVEALEGPFHLVDCAGESRECGLDHHCPTRKPLQVVHRRFQQFMDQLTLNEIVGSVSSTSPEQDSPEAGYENTHLHG
ncbi:MAG: Rrf2 family transcriptional regulator, partial [Deltaproteobacteria bacterium]|nr:Rrf2 family transcriptional regulator [Deltaproteobacteria bacterium]